MLVSTSIPPKGLYVNRVVYIYELYHMAVFGSCEPLLPLFYFVSLGCSLLDAQERLDSVDAMLQGSLYQAVQHQTEP